MVGAVAKGLGTTLNKSDDKSPQGSYLASLRCIFILMTTTATYDAPNQLTAFGGTDYVYDRNGNLKAFGSNSLNYDASNKWTSGTVNGSSVAFGYDGHGRRSFRTIGSGRTELWYNTTGLTLESGTNNVTYLRDGDGTLLSRSGGAGYYTYGRDRLGSTTAVVTTGQALANTYAYDPWGETIGSTGTTYNPFLFTGVYKDGATGLYSMTQRYYQSASGRFRQLEISPQLKITSLSDRKG